MVALSIAIAVQLVEIVFVLRAQKLTGHLIVLELVDKALIADSSAVAREQIGSVVVDMALQTFVLAHREPVDDHILN